MAHTKPIGVHRSAKLLGPLGLLGAAKAGTLGFILGMKVGQKGNKDDEAEPKGDADDDIIKERIDVVDAPTETTTKDPIAEMMTSVQEAVEAVTKGIGEVMESIGDSTKNDATEDGTDPLGDFVQGVQGAVGGVVRTVGEAIDGLGNGQEDNANDKIYDLDASDEEENKDPIGDLLRGIQGAVGGVLNGIGQAIDNLGQRKDDSPAVQKQSKMFIFINWKRMRYTLYFAWFQVWKYRLKRFLMRLMDQSEQTPASILHIY